MVENVSTAVQPPAVPDANGTEEEEVPIVEDVEPGDAIRRDEMNQTVALRAVTHSE